MPHYSYISRERLQTAHEDLIKIFERVLEVFDHTIVEGHRGKDRQNLLVNQGKSQVQWPNSKHNRWPSLAIDAAPYLGGSISWNTYHCVYFAGFVMATAEALRRSDEIKSKLRWGGDWDRDWKCLTDQNFQDLVHFEIL